MGNRRECIALTAAVPLAAMTNPTRHRPLQASTNRGLTERGRYADIVVFAPATITDRATFDDPKQLNTGMQLVPVNGVPVIATAR